VPTYRYYSADLLTGNVLAELPLYGVWMTRRLSDMGEMTGTFKLGTQQHSDTELLQSTEPGKTALYVERDNTLIWGGIIWSRTYAEDARICNMTAQTFESIFDHVVIEQDFVHQVEDQMSIFIATINQMQAQDANNFGLEVSNIPTSSGVLRTVLFPGYESHFYEEIISQLVGVENGFDYCIDVLPGIEPDKPRKSIRAGYPILGSRDATTDVPVFDYPGNILTFWWPESATRAGTKFVGLGAGAGIGMLRGEAAANDLLDAGYPAWYVVNSYKGITEQQILNERVRSDRAAYRMPVSTPTFQLKPDASAAFDAWQNLGSMFQVHVESRRFPTGKEIFSRMIGWELVVADSDDTEQVKFFIEGDTESDRPGTFTYDTPLSS
jgi:hypothetical protein